MDAAGDEASALPPVLFVRPGKKRKTYRQRAEAAEEASGPAPADDLKKDEKSATPEVEVSSALVSASRTTDPDSGNDENEEDEVDMTVAELLRLRKSRRTKLGGVEFTGGEDKPQRGMRGDDFDDYDGSDMDLDFLSSESLPVGVRFAPQTGLIGELVNKHMEEYVEAEMAKRYKPDQTGGQGTSYGGNSTYSAFGNSGASGQTSSEHREQLAMKGKLHEIDLGNEARARNIALTERATRRLHGQDADDGDDDGRKPRLGRDGRLIQRKRRGSEDIKRDQIVEQLLHENRMDVDVYSTAKEQAPPTEGRPTDDRIAEQFRREFMEAVAQRMRRKRKPLGPPTKPKTRNEEEILRGPKLGGSRNVRSQMRDKLLQKQEEERQNMPKYEQQLAEQRRKANRRR